MRAITALVSELQKKTKLRIKMGDPKEKISNEMVRQYGDELGSEEVRSEVESIIDNFGDYKLIQKLMRAKIVQEIDGRDCIILDPDTKSATKIRKEQIKEIFHRSVDFSDRIYTCKFEYDPYTMKQLYEDHTETWVYNQYRPPFWQEECFYTAGEEIIEPLVHVPEIYKRFLKHLVNDDQKSYEYILDWLANALQRRNFCILTTIGNQGVGKGTLGEIMRALVGDDNYAETGNRILEERFNSQIQNKRIVYCDEVSVKSVKEEERLKALVNNALEIEAKGKDAKRSVNFASFYFSSNSMDAIRLHADDRRFSIVSLTDKKLTEAFSIDEIRSFTAPENIEDFARYLSYREVNEFAMLKVFTSQHTENIRSASLAAWHDWFLDEYAVDHAGKTVKIEEISAAIEDRYGSRLRPGKKAFMELSKIYPGKLTVYRPKIGNKQVWAVKFPEGDQDDQTQRGAEQSL